MNYQKFLQEICEKMQGQFEEVEISCIKVSAVNRDREGIVVKNTGRKTAPIVYLEDIYQDYTKNRDMDFCMEKTAERIKSYLALPVPEDILCGDILSWEKISKYLYPFLVSTDRNQAMLKIMENRSFLDLSVCYMLMLPTDGKDETSKIMRVTHDIAAVWEQTEEEIYKKAMENAKKGIYVIHGMEETLSEILEKEYGGDIPEEMNLSLSEVRSFGLGLNVMSSRMYRYGAAAMLDMDLLEKYGRKCGSDFYIIPSSIHEVLLLPDDGKAGAEELNEMVRTVNEENLDEEDILSDHVYYYSRAEKKIRCC